MKGERIISAYKTYFKDFIDTLNEAEARKVFYVNSEPSMAETSSGCSLSSMMETW